MEKENFNGAMEKLKKGASSAATAVKKTAVNAGTKVKDVATSENAQKALAKVKTFYIVDLLVRLVKGKNVPALIYLLLNVAMIMGVFYWASGSVGGMFLGLLLYVVCVCVALSPLGEFILRLTHGCNKITDPQIQNRLEPLFREVYDRARHNKKGYNINPKVKLYINDELEPNAFALGRSTVCVTQGLLQLPDDQIKGILGHEMGHLANHDTDLILLITVGNMLISAFVTLVRVGIIIMEFIFNIASAFIGGSEGFLSSALTSFASFLSLVFVNVLTWIWTKIGVLLVMKSSRSQEFAADRFSCDLGYTEPLLAFFESINVPAPQTKQGLIERLKGETGLFAVLTSTHPSTQKRIDTIKRTRLNAENR